MLEYSLGPTRCLRRQQRGRLTDAVDHYRLALLFYTIIAVVVWAPPDLAIARFAHHCGLRCMGGTHLIILSFVKRSHWKGAAASAGWSSGQTRQILD